jgi:two-component sensor histidine kinase
LFEGSEMQDPGPGSEGGGSDPRDLRYRTLFEGVSDGFALVEAIRDADGRLIDYVVLEANPALHSMLERDEPIVGRRQSEVLRNAPPSWLQACERALQGHSLRFEFFAANARRWFDIHLSRIAPDQLAQLVVDVTDRKHAEVRHSEMFDELNHRVKNNLAIVSSMLTLQSRVTPSPEVREHLAKAVDRIQTIADVHASLYRSGRKDDVDFAAYMVDLCSRLRDSVLDTTRVDLEVDAEPAVVPLDKAVALGVVVNELVTNAAKYAYPPPVHGTIVIRLARDDGSLVLQVEDSGPGLPKEVPKTGLGMQLVRSLVQQLGATLKVSRPPGAVFAIRLPDPGGRGTAQGAQARLL